MTRHLEGVQEVMERLLQSEGYELVRRETDIQRQQQQYEGRDHAEQPTHSHQPLQYRNLRTEIRLKLQAQLQLSAGRKRSFDETNLEDEVEMLGGGRDDHWSSCSTISATSTFSDDHQPRRKRASQHGKRVKDPEDDRGSLHIINHLSPDIAAERPFKCDICGRSYTSKPIMRRHRKLKHDSPLGAR
ncbi:hypothetical protein IWZ00DRAFT_546794 [Phyllosticta capitalensis]|uniref:C2H2-type domain-containing protein n=1 Tax=Phyllosticta capitalensis TaxID=121624 RepID=A0ABR1YAC3_9PEZI